ncbi:response regulator [Gorillibacterium sp. sgz5001074]|uniref:response regulator n=1 Tax=Gorillibacterium sp. sgz5001074 TaxID=3446695 RepID=UPI003F67004A
MKALIVDDEKHVRDAIRLLTDWESFGITHLLEAEDGETAVRIIREEHPELVFTDMMMPGMGGAGLLEWIHGHAPGTKTVVISGHDDFDLVRAAVKFGGLDYILKPIDPGELQDAVRKAVESRRQQDAAVREQQQKTMEVNRIKPVYWDRMLSDLLDDPGSFDKVKTSLVKELGLPADCRECRVAVIAMDTVPEELRRKFSSGMDLLYFSLTNICNEVLNERQSGYAFRHWGGSGYIVLLYWRHAEGVPDDIRRIHESIYRTLKGRFDFGLGGSKPFPGGVGAAYREAVQALRSRNLLKRTGWIHQPVQDPAASRKPLAFGEYEERLRLAIRSASQEQILMAVGMWFQSLERLTAISPDQYELWTREYGLFQARWAKELFGEEQGELPEEWLAPIHPEPPLHDDGTLSLVVWQDRLIRSLRTIAEQYRRQQQEDRHVIFDIAKYIEAHYREEITLQDIADRFFLSREYISRKFKQEFKENLSDYIGRIRIGKAKLLLLNPDSRIAQVAELVGYQDEKYFSKVFKKLTGQTPGEYRKNPTPCDGEG